MHFAISFTSFAFIILTARQVGHFFANRGLPLISGYLVAGIIAGPFILGLVDSGMVGDLRIVEEISLGFIAFAAGSELNIRTLRQRFRSIAWHSIGQVVAIVGVGVAGVLLLANDIPFLAGQPFTVQLAAALITGAILVARSPSSAIAIITELRASGNFTRTVLGVTVLMDVVVVILFAISTSFAELLLTIENFHISTLLILPLELGISIGSGLLLAAALHYLMKVRWHRHFKTVIILLVGALVFAFTHLVRDYSHQYLPFEMLLEPLLICMVASFALVT